jgi:hypothetical protein
VDQPSDESGGKRSRNAQNCAHDKAHGDRPGIEEPRDNANDKSDDQHPDDVHGGTSFNSRAPEEFRRCSSDRAIGPSSIRAHRRFDQPIAVMVDGVRNRTLGNYSFELTAVLLVLFNIVKISHHKLIS